MYMEEQPTFRLNDALYAFVTGFVNIALPLNLTCVGPVGVAVT